jgi:hypothetical protein
MVLAAIGLTVGLVVLAEAGLYVRNQGMAQFTGEVLKRVGDTVRAYQGTFGAYPPDRLDRWRGAIPNPGPSHQVQTGGGACLFRAIVATGGEPAWAAGPMKRALGDTDGDGLEEVIDGWGRPLLYYNGYGAERKLKDKPGELPAPPGVSESKMRALNSSLAERWVHSDRPLIDSAGPDGEFNTSDDLRCDEDPSVSPPGE